MPTKGLMTAGLFPVRPQRTQADKQYVSPPITGMPLLLQIRPPLPPTVSRWKVVPHEAADESVSRVIVDGGDFVTQSVVPLSQVSM